MQRKRAGLVPIGDAVSGLDDEPVAALATLRPRRYTTSPSPIR